MKRNCGFITLFVAQLLVIFLIVFESEGNPNNRCGPNEEWNSCGSIPPNCTRTCENRLIRFKCKAVCDRVCYCKEKYIRLYKGGPCILEENCPPLE